MNFRSHASVEFWMHFNALPGAIQEQADRKFALFQVNPHHPSLRLKTIGPYCSVRISSGYRALARQRDNDLFWFWIGPHDEYDRLLKG